MRDEHERFVEGVIPHDIDPESIATLIAFQKAIEDNKRAETLPDIWD